MVVATQKWHAPAAAVEAGQVFGADTLDLVDHHLCALGSGFY